MLGAVLCLFALAAPAAPPSGAAGPPSLEDAARRHGPAIVGVWSGNVVRPGFFVSSSGVAVTVLPVAPAGAGPEGLDVVVELAGGDRRKGRVLVRDDDGLALVEVERLDKDAVFASLSVAAEPPKLRPDAWLLALSFVDGRAAPALGGLRRAEAARWRLDLPVDAGAAVLAQGRVVGVVVARAGVTASVAVPAARITALAKRIPRL